MTEQSRTPLGTISMVLGIVPVLALVSWFVFYTPCGHPRRAIIEGAMFWGTIVAVPFGLYAALKERPRRRALIGLALGLVPLICTILLIVAAVFPNATGGGGIPGILDLATTGESAPANFEAGVYATTETKYYDITGSTMEDLAAQAAVHGPHGFIAETVPYYHWNYTYLAENGACRIDKIRVDTRIVFTYPRWANPESAPELAGEWGTRIAQVEQHERGHEKLGRTAGQGIRDAIAGIPPSPTCAELEKEIEARAQAVIAKGREAGEEFDRVTDHGKRLAGAVP